MLWLVLFTWLLVSVNSDPLYLEVCANLLGLHQFPQVRPQFAKYLASGSLTWF